MKQVWRIGKLILVSVLFYIAVRFVGQTWYASDITTVFLNVPISATKRAVEICEEEAGQEEPASVCFWREKPQISVTCRETGQNCILKEIITAGDPDLVIQGSSPIRIQKKNCMLDVRSCEELFGTREAAGQTVLYQGQSYIVCGTFESAQKILIRQAEKYSSDDMADLDRIALRFGTTGNSGNDLDQFLVKYSLSGDGVNLRVLVVLAGDLCLLVPVLTGFFLIKDLVKCSKKGCMIAAIGLTVILLFGVFRQFQIPSEMVPSKWSDFGFWKNFYEGQRRNLLLLLGSAAGEIQINVLSALVRSVFCNLVACCFSH